MTLSYLDIKAPPRIRPAPRGLPKNLLRFAAVRTDLVDAFGEVTSSPQFGPVLLRVSSALLLGFGLVHLVKAFIT